MKRFYSFLTAIILFVTTQAMANDVVVKGILKYPDGSPVANQKVKVSVDTTNSSTCKDSKEVLTNPNGFYTVTLSCSGNIMRVVITTQNCNGTYLIERPEVPVSGVIERNFTICKLSVLPTNCEARFKFENTLSSRFTFKFNSSESHGTSATDNIIKRRWRFGDGTILEGNEISPLHTYPGKGVYEVCLTIFTAAGCEKTVCQKITIEDNSTNCLAYFVIHPTTNNWLAFQFKSDSSKGISATDHIIKRRWRFGDGSVLEGNEISPVHTFPGKGVYEICLTIVTAAGCEKTLCKKIVIEVPVNTLCKPEFSFTVSPNNPNEIKFNSIHSTVAPGDNIVSRKWIFGDGKEATTIDPVHVYEHNGTYNVCLVIKTANGCIKEICKTVVINTRKCEARFVYELMPAVTNIAGYPVRFNSNTSSSNDSIISRTWFFGDGTSATSIDPTHNYKQPGLYNVCLVIKTRNGCESKVCKQVLVGPNAPGCSPHFTFERLSPKKIKFNSAMSWTAIGDDIVQRTWDFGDGTFISTGNEISVSKEYTRAGIYTVCLKIKTAKGCESKVCHTVKIEETSAGNVTNAPIKIVALFPSPVHERMTTDVWSLHTNVKATIAIYDIYGVKKWEGQKVLLQGNNITVVATGFLLPGPYFFKVTTMYGVQSRQFFKL